jgi:hypothetical protein
MIHPAKLAGQLRCAAQQFRALCQLLGHQLTVESIVGQGSTFRIIMPV